jgi:pimeloyl-ACP methyl ester carboxylesterase
MQYTMTKGNFINTSQGFFHYHVRGGSGRQVHFCHGLSLSAGTYLPFLESLSRHDLKIFAPDLRGHGYSTKENTLAVKNWDIFVKDLEQFVLSITHPPVIGIGHSIGGYFTYAAAALYPGLFSKIILLDPIILPPKIVWLCALARLTGLDRYHPLPRMTRKKKCEFPSKEGALEHYSGKGMFKSWRPEFVQAFVDTAIEQESATTWELCCRPEFEAQIYESVPFETWRFVRLIHIPVLVAGGEKSTLFYKQSGLRLAKKIRDCRFMILENLSHFLMMEDPDKVMDAILPFIRNP